MKRTFSQAPETWLGRAVGFSRGRRLPHSSLCIWGAGRCVSPLRPPPRPPSPSFPSLRRRRSRASLIPAHSSLRFACCGRSAPAPPRSSLRSPAPAYPRMPLCGLGGRRSRLRHARRPSRPLLPLGHRLAAIYCRGLLLALGRPAAVVCARSARLAGVFPVVDRSRRAPMLAAGSSPSLAVSSLGRMRRAPRVASSCGVIPSFQAHLRPASPLRAHAGVGVFLLAMIFFAFSPSTHRALNTNSSRTQHALKTPNKARRAALRAPKVAL